MDTYSAPIPEREPSPIHDKDDRRPMPEAYLVEAVEAALALRNDCRLEGSRRRQFLTPFLPPDYHRLSIPGSCLTFTIAR